MRARGWRKKRRERRWGLRRERKKERRGMGERKGKEKKIGRVTEIQALS